MKLLDEQPAYTTADIAKALMDEREKKLPVRSSYFGGIVPQVSAQEAAINRPDPVERASLLPFATYPDGTTRLALPGMIAEDIPRAFTAPSRAYRGEIPDEDMISEGLNFAGNMAIGGSAVPKGSAVARVAANASESAAPGVVMADAARQQTPIRAYHGSRSSWDGPFDPSRSSHSVPSTFFGTQADANYFASSLGNHPSGSSIRPVDIDATGMRSVDWPSISGGGVDPHLYRSGPMDDLLQTENAKGSPGVVIKNIRTDEGLPVGDYVAMLENGRGRVRSATTGDILFENGANASAPGAIASEAARQPLPVKMEVPFYRGSTQPQTSVDYSRPYWGTTSQDLPNHYVKSRTEGYLDSSAQPNITPAVARFRNPLEIDAQNNGWSQIPFEGRTYGTDDLADLAKSRGHDGLVINRVYDEGRWNPDEGLPSTVAALGPGTVSSAFDPNNILYSNAKASAPGAIVSQAADQPRGIREENPLLVELWRLGLLGR